LWRLLGELQPCSPAGPAASTPADYAAPDDHGPDLTEPSSPRRIRHYGAWIVLAHVFSAQEAEKPHSEQETASVYIRLTYSFTPTKSLQTQEDFGPDYPTQVHGRQMFAAAA